MSNYALQQMTLMRIHLEGPLGVGKTTVLNELMPYHFSTCSTGPSSSYKIPKEFNRIREPMNYWRYTFVDLIRANGRAEELLHLPYDWNRPAITRDINNKHANEQRNAIRQTAREALLALQMQFADSYIVLDDRLRKRYGESYGTGYSDSPDAVFLFDRHTISSTLCFPAARVLKGDCDVSCLFSAMIKTPYESPGCNLVIFELSDEQAHTRQILERNRPGEKVDRLMLSALRASYRMLIATIQYANHRKQMKQCGHSGGINEDDWKAVPWFTTKRNDQILNDITYSIPLPCSSILAGEGNCCCCPPSLSYTLLSLLKVPELCTDSGYLRPLCLWAVESLLEKLAGIKVYPLIIDGKSPKTCAQNISDMMLGMSTTKCTSEDLSKMNVDLSTYFTDAVL